LKESGLTKSHSTLIEESQLSTEFSVCDNVDLETLYLEFSSYYFIKFGKKPRFVRKIENSPILTAATLVDTTAARQALAKKRTSLKTAPNITTIFPENQRICDLETSLQVTSLSPPQPPLAQQGDSNISRIFMKSMRNFLSSHPPDWRDMSEMIIKDVIRKNLCVKWDDIVGLDEAKIIIKESVIFPLKYPQLYGQMQSWKGERKKFASLFHSINFSTHSCSTPRHSWMWKNPSRQSTLHRNARKFYIFQHLGEHAHFQMAR
jgi:katanin p60 ATPase-containing subunit A1